MASVSSNTATMAAAGFDKRCSTASSLQTPGSGTFPSEMLSPMAGSPGFLKREDSLKTPITPPSAYLDFLKNFSPAIQSPTSTTSARFSFNDKSFDKASDMFGPRSAIMPPTSQPALSRNTSYDSNSSTSTERSAVSLNTATTTTDNRKQPRPESPRITIPPSPFARPGPRSARTPRRLHIPQSPFSPALNSAQNASSPYSSTPLSAAAWSSSFSPRSDPADASQPSKVHVRHVVTRTVTYCRTALDPAPRGKRRKIQAEADEDAMSTTSASASAMSSGTTSKAASEEPLAPPAQKLPKLPPVKQERIGRIEEETASETAAASA